MAISLRQASDMLLPSLIEYLTHGAPHVTPKEAKEREIRSARDALVEAQYELKSKLFNVEQRQLILDKLLSEP